MAGIAGILTPYPAFLTKERMQRMVEKNIGSPSNSEIWMDDDKRIGFKTASQYLHYTIQFSGELYNSYSLLNELKSLGYNFTSIDDAIIVMAAYDYWKEACMSHLEGPFVFALYNSNDCSVLLTRDRIGEKSLFYYGEFRERGRFVQLLFASDKQSLWRADAPCSLDATMVLNYLTLGYTRHPNKKMATFYSDILSLPPGNYLKIFPKDGRTQMRTWYRPILSPIETMKEEETIDQFANIFEHSLHQTISSKSTYCLNNTSDTANLFLSSFLPKKGIEPFLLRTESSSSVDTFPSEQNTDLDNFLNIMEEPVADIQCYMDYKSIQEQQLIGSSIILSTMSEEEILGRKSNYILYFLQYLFKHNFSNFLEEKKLFEKNNLLYGWKWLNVFPNLSLEKRALKLQRKKLKKQSDFPYINQEFLLRYQLEDSLRQPEIHRPEDAMFYHIFTLGMGQKLFAYSHMADFFSQKVKFPLLSYPLIEFMLRIPTNYKFRNGYNEWLFRKYTETTLQEKAWLTSNKPLEKATIKLSKERVREAKNILVQNKILHPNCITKNEAVYDRDIEWRIVNIAYHIKKNGF